jgi:hypothetical protein
MALGATGISAAVAGDLPPWARAIVREVIDVPAVLDAIRTNVLSDYS